MHNGFVYYYFSNIPYILGNFILDKDEYEAEDPRSSQRNAGKVNDWSFTKMH